MLFTKKHKQELLEPISDNSPCGVFLKGADNNAYRLLRNEFNLAQMALRKLSQNPDVADIDSLRNENRERWSLLSDHLYETFNNITKDIELISWFICSQLILDSSLESIANSLEWFSELVEQEWSNLNPALSLDKDLGVAESERVNQQELMRAKAFSQLAGDSEASGLLYAPLLFQPLLGDISFFDYKSGERKGKLNELKLSAAPLVEQEGAAIRIRLDNVARCLAAITQLESFLAKQLNTKKAMGVSFGFLKKIFNAMENAIIQLSGFTNSKPIIDAASDVESDRSQKYIHPYPGSSSLSRDILHRDVAFHQLREIADYFRQSEPHSPISYLIEKAIYWGYLPLPKLLKEIFAEQNDDAITKMLNNAGLNQQERISLPQLPEEKVDSSFKKISDPLMIEREGIRNNGTFNRPEQDLSENSTSSIATTALRW